MEFLQTALNNAVLTLTVNRPPANAYNLALIGELRAAFAQAAQDSQVRVVVLTASGRVFGAGQDIGEIQSYGGELSYRAHLFETYNPLVLQIREIGKPVVAAINGTVAGASLGIALACDLRIAADDARFVVGFSGIGLVPDSGVSLLLPALIGLGRATELYLSNAPISAEQGLAWGMLNRVVPFDALAQTTTALAGQLAGAPIGAFGLTKQAFNRAILPNLTEVLACEADLQELAGKNQEHREGVAAFLEKRKAKFD
jgi:2-(1,2-epoxy-1,2-dihydrophenyl)acetyl-CoA isomerase